MKKVQGDLLAFAQEGTFDVIVHGCNCYCKMGAGIAKDIKLQFPEAFYADCDTPRGDASKLGNFSTARIQREGDSVDFIIVNAYSQFHWKGKGVKVDYDAIRSIFQKLKQEFSGLKIGYPLIGAGLAGGDWSLISAIIDEELESEDHTLVEFVPPSEGQPAQKARTREREREEPFFKPVSKKFKKS